MDFTTRINGIKQAIENRLYAEDILFDKEKLIKQTYLNFQIDDCYDYMDKVEAETRKMILNILFDTFLNWKQQLAKIDQAYYLGIWIYEPRLPKSEIVCAIGNEKINYYQNKCFDLKAISGEKPKYVMSDKSGEELKWSSKIDYDYLTELEINFPKDSYKNASEWENDQFRFQEFVTKSNKTLNTVKGKTYCLDVGTIWTGEIVK